MVLVDDESELSPDTELISKCPALLVLRFRSDFKADAEPEIFIFISDWTVNKRDIAKWFGAQNNKGSEPQPVLPC